MPLKLKQNTRKRVLCFGGAASLLASAFQPSAVLGQAAAESVRHENHFGGSYLPVPGTAVLFAVTETTVAEFNAFVEGSRYPWIYAPHFEQGGDHPVVGVSLSDAQAFCNWLTDTEREAGRITDGQSYRLPSNAEWSAAAGLARARKRSAELTAEETLADQRRFPWGLKWPPPANAANLAAAEIPEFDDAYEFTAPVGKCTPSQDGLHDLAGNVWEWVQDVSLDRQVKARLRGGAWAYFNEQCLRSIYEYEAPESLRAPTIGFRVVFEDRSRSADMLAAASRPEAGSPAKSGLFADRVESDADEVAEMRRRIVSKHAAGAAALPAPADLKPAVAGQAHVNSLGVTLVPLGASRVLLASTEASVAEFEAFLKDAKQEWPGKPAYPSGPEHPAAGVTWRMAALFCDWLTRVQREAGLIPEGARYRLPTDQEWSFAGGLDEEEGADLSQRDAQAREHYPWDGGWPPPPQAANLESAKVEGFDDSYAYTSPVAVHKANQRGFHELGGNVAEWCQDEWPGQAGHRVYRGGSWLSAKPEELFTGRRHHAAEDEARANVGFRYALEWAKPSGG